MSSDSNKINDGTSLKPSEPAPCANGCGFFGSAATMNLCSKCFRDLQVKDEQTASAKAAMDKLVSNVITIPPPSSSSFSSSGSQHAPPRTMETAVDAPVKASNRCLTCKKKVGVIGFTCRCGDTFCGTHRYPEKHDCEFDFKKTGRDAIAKGNPIVKADKVNRI